MKRTLVFLGWVGLPVFLSAWLLGCQAETRKAGHAVVEPKTGHVIACQLCYDEAVKVRHALAKGTAWARYETITKHRCPGCKAEMSVYTEDGKPMIKCQKCAPAGVACDLCQPPAARK